MRTIGFLVNPIAGMGGSVGLKGTDGLVREASARGAVPLSGKRSERTLRVLSGKGIQFFTCSGSMGADHLTAAGIPNYDVVYHCRGESTAEDTRMASRLIARRQIDLILFCGGDGTARDVYSAVGDTVPILGIPAGVKMHSAVFALTPEAAGEVAGREGPFKLCDAEILDVDEEAYRGGELRTRLYGIARVPCGDGQVQGTKQVLEEPDEERAKEAIGRFLAAVMRNTPGILYILGPGTTTASIARALGSGKTLLGFDAFVGGRITAMDLDETRLLALLSGHPDARLIVTPIGAQGFILGRGSQQVSPAVLSRIGVSQVIVAATPGKLAATPQLYIDSGDPALDDAFGGTVRVVTGDQTAQRRKLRSGRELHEKSRT